MLSKTIIGYKNLLLFTAYYFSTPLLIVTFLSPWKRITWRVSRRGFHPTDIFTVTISNLVARIIGMIVRSFMILLGLFGIAAIAISGLPIAFLIALFDRNSSLFSFPSLLTTRPLAGEWHYGYTPTLDRYATDLYYQKLPYSLVGRISETTRLVTALTGRGHNNVLIIGEPGTGRHALIVHASHALVSMRFLEFDFVAFLKDKKTDEEQEGALEELFAEAKDAGNVSLVISHFEHFKAYIPTVSRYVEHPNLRIIGITNPFSYHNDLYPDKELMKNMTSIMLEQPGYQDIVAIMKTLLSHAAVGFEDQDALIAQIVDGSNQLAYLESKHQPEAAISLGEEFLSFLKKQDALKKKNVATELTDFLQNRLHTPAGRVTESEKEKLTKLAFLLSKRVISQDEAVESVAHALQRKRLNITTDVNKPIGSFLFLGPTGVGKTETAKALASVYFENEEHLLRLDMESFGSHGNLESVKRELANRIRSVPYGVLLLDEIEKTSKEIQDFFLTILDEGYCTDPNGNRVSTTHLVIIATSNAASEFIRETVNKNTTVSERFNDIVVEYVLKHNLFSPEFLNRFDAVIAFKPLNNQAVRTIIRMKLDRLCRQLVKQRREQLIITDELVEYVYGKIRKREFGAREIERVIQTVVEDKLAEQMLKNDAV